MPRMIVHASLVCAVIILSACAESLHQVQRDTELLGVPVELEKEIDASVRKELDELEGKLGPG